MGFIMRGWLKRRDVSYFIIVPTLQRWNAAVDAPASSYATLELCRMTATPERWNYEKFLVHHLYRINNIEVTH
jgi:hypothetical protein